MAKSISMNRLVTASNALITRKMSASKNSHVRLSMPQVKPPSLEISTVSMYTTLIPRDLNGTKYAASRSKITTR